MDAVFHKAANPPQFRCLGATLLPLTVGHLFLLRKFCPDVFGEQEIERGTLAVAAFICAHPQGRVEALFRRWFIRFAFELWGWLCQKRILAVERARFEAYLRESLDPPRVWRDLSEPLLTCQSPLEMRLLVMLESDLHYSEQDALNVTVIKANALWATFGEVRNKFKFEDDRTEGLFEFARQMEAEKANKAN
jgi:hypothetical protein